MHILLGRLSISVIFTVLLLATTAASTTLVLSEPYIPGEPSGRIDHFNGTMGGGMFIADFDVLWTVMHGDGSAQDPYLISFYTNLEGDDPDTEQCPQYHAFCFVGLGTGFGRYLNTTDLEFYGTFSGTAHPPSWLAAYFVPGQDVPLDGTFDFLLIPCPTGYPTHCGSEDYYIYGDMTFTNAPEPGTVWLLGAAFIPTFLRLTRHRTPA